MRHSFAHGWGVLALVHVACGSGSAEPKPDGSAEVRAAADAADIADVRDAAAVEDVRDAAAVTDVPRTGAPTLADLEGAWYAIVAGDAELDTYGTLRVEGATYHQVYDPEGAYCAETGTVAVTGPSVSFSPQRVQGLGECTLAAARTAAATWAGSAVMLAFPSRTVRLGRARNVPKAFVTVETHHGDFAGDGALPGANAIAKADAFCNRSLARPDARPYKAVLVDGVSRAFPDKDWPLRADTTYYRADGVVNVFRTAPDARPTQRNHALLPGEDAGFYYAWTGLFCSFEAKATCNGWSSSMTGLIGGVGDVRVPDTTFGCNVGVQCSQSRSPLICVSQ